MRRTTMLARSDGRVPRWIWFATAAAVLVVVLSCVSVPLLVLRPGSWVTPARGTYPAPAAANAGVVAQLRAAPVILDRRLRVFATRNDVWAEPLTAPDGADAYWSYHRWPAQVVGIVAFGADGATPPVVVVKWSDGLLAAMDAEHGKIAWKTHVPTRDSDEYWGRRTGTRTAYGDEALFSLYSARSGSSPVVISSGDTEVLAFDPVSGRRLWTLDLPACHGVDWTGEQVFATILCSEGIHTIHLYDAGTGRPVGTWVPPGLTSSSAPADQSWIRWLAGCRTASSECQDFEVPDNGRWRIHADGSVTRESEPTPGISESIAGDVIIRQTHGQVTGVRRETGAQMWQIAFDARWPTATDAGVAYLLSSENELACVEVTTGAVRAVVKLPDASAWSPSAMYAADGFVMIDRVNPDGRERDGDDLYYYGSRPVVLAAC